MSYVKIGTVLLLKKSFFREKKNTSLQNQYVLRAAFRIQKERYNFSSTIQADCSFLQSIIIVYFSINKHCFAFVPSKKFKFVYHSKLERIPRKCGERKTRVRSSKFKYNVHFFWLRIRRTDNFVGRKKPMVRIYSTNPCGFLQRGFLMYRLVFARKLREQIPSHFRDHPW